MATLTTRGTTITPCLWFADQGEEAANFYCGIFPNSRITAISRYGKVGREVHGQPAGSVMTVSFELDGQPFTALNGGPIFKFTEAVSFQVFCRTQGEIDTYWKKLSAGGDKKSQVCGWLKDKFGLSWQIVPETLAQMTADPDAAKAGRVMKSLLKMKKLDMAKLEKAYRGEGKRPARRS
jgi:predicted 3-demethylubiquinone-9 3-methyltransferase (glyoxalase superfamily)